MKQEKRNRRKLNMLMGFSLSFFIIGSTILIGASLFNMWPTIISQIGFIIYCLGFIGILLLFLMFGLLRIEHILRGTKK